MVSVCRPAYAPLLALLIVSLGTTFATADDTADETPAVDVDEAGPAREFSDRQVAAKRAYATGVVMLGGILIIGVALVAVILLWGNRARRIARQALPTISPRDDLWYLKKKPGEKTVEGLPGDPAGGADESGTPHES